SFWSATAFGYFLARFALHDQQVTTRINTIGMGIARLTALMTFGDDLIRNALGHTFVKNEILADKPVFQIFFFNLPGVFNNTTFKLKHIFKTLMLEPGRCFFAAYSSRAVHYQVPVFEAFYIFQNIRE